MGEKNRMTDKDIGKREMMLLSPYIPKGIYTLFKNRDDVPLTEFLETASEFMEKKNFLFLLKKIEEILSVKLDNYLKIREENKLFNLAENKKNKEEKTESEFITIKNNFEKDIKKEFSEEKGLLETDRDREKDENFVKEKELNTVEKTNKNKTLNEDMGFDKI
jgi:hypothetical protein